MKRPTLKEEYATILDFLPNGYPLDMKPGFRKIPIAQAIGRDHLVLLEFVPKKDVILQPGEEVYIGEGKRDKIHHIVGKLSIEKLTETAKGELDYIAKEFVSKNEQRFVDFFNNSMPINTRRHQIELLPGIGKKHMMAILNEREKKPFESLEDVKKRVKLIPDPRTIVIKRVLIEIKEEDKYRIFI